MQVVKKEVRWDIKVVVVDLIGGRERCTKRFAMIAKRNVKFLLSPAEIVRFTVRIVSPSVKIAVVKK